MNIYKINVRYFTMNYKTKPSGRITGGHLNGHVGYERPHRARVRYLVFM